MAPRHPVPQLLVEHNPQHHRPRLRPCLQAQSKEWALDLEFSSSSSSQMACPHKVVCLNILNTLFTNSSSRWQVEEVGLGG